jgi:hypothetical protein
MAMVLVDRVNDAAVIFYLHIVIVTSLSYIGYKVAKVILGKCLVFNRF